LQTHGGVETHGGVAAMVDAPADPRMTWVEERVVQTLKMKGDKFKKMVQTEDAQPLRNFIEDSDCMTVFFVDGAKEMYSHKLPPANTKKKVMFMLKPLDDMKLTKENMDSVVVGDMSPKLLDNMLAVFQEVYLPLLSNTKNQYGWPEMVSREVLEQFHRNVASVYVALGQSMGETLLPLPPGDMLAVDRAPKTDKDRVHVLETAVVTWTAQIKGVLKTDAEDSLKRAEAEQIYQGSLEGVRHALLASP
jgi:dynein heavy chain